MTASPSLASLLQRFFTERLVRQQRASPHTIASYRDAFRLLLRFAQERLGKAPSSLALDDLDAALVGAFLDHVEQHRRNTPRTRNVRLAAIHASCHHVAISEPAHLDGTIFFDVADEDVTVLHLGASPLKDPDHRPDAVQSYLIAQNPHPSLVLRLPEEYPPKACAGCVGRSGASMS